MLKSPFRRYSNVAEQRPMLSWLFY